MTLAEKQQTLRAMLTHYRDSVETLQRGDYGGKIQFTSRRLQMPDVWHRCGYPELNLRLLELRASSRCIYNHVAGRYLIAEKIPRTIMFRKGQMLGLGGNEEIVSWPGSEWTDDKKRKQASGVVVGVVVARWPEWVNLTHVDMGVEWVARRYKGFPIAPNLLPERKEAA